MEIFVNFRFANIYSTLLSNGCHFHLTLLIVESIVLNGADSQVCVQDSSFRLVFTEISHLFLVVSIVQLQLETLCNQINHQETSFGTLLRGVNSKS